METIDVSPLKTGNVTDMSGMFEQCSSLKNLDLSTFDTGKVLYMSHMFDGCSALEALDISSFDISAVTSSNFMFYNDDKISSVALGEKFPLIHKDMKLRNGGWANKSAPDVCVSGSGQFAVISNSGKNTYIFTGNALPVSLGDCNFDGEIGAADLVTLSSFILGKKTAVSITTESSDFDGDGIVDIFDMVALRKLVTKEK